MSLLLVVRYPEEGPGLLGWARRMAEGMESELEVLVCDPEAGSEIAWGEEAGERPDYLAGVDCRWGKVIMTKALSTLVNYIELAPVEFVLVGKHNSGKHASDSAERRLSRAVFEKVRCAVVVMRLPEDQVVPGRILVPCGGGAHSRAALRLASRTGETTAFFVEPETDEVSREVGERMLGKAMRQAEVEGVEKKVALGTKVGEEIRRETESGV